MSTRPVGPAFGPVALLLVFALALAACAGRAEGTPRRSGSPGASPSVSVSPGQSSPTSGTVQSPSPPAGGALDPCRLVTAREVATVTGAKVLSSKRGGQDQEQCVHQLDTPGLVAVSLIASPGEGYLEQLRRDLPGGEDVSGLGEDAYWGGGSLAVGARGRVVQVYVSAGKELDARQISQLLASVAITRV